MTSHAPHNLHAEYPRHTAGILGPLIWVSGLFGVLTIWCTILSIAYAYGGRAGWIGWLRMPEGIAPFARLNLGMSDVVAYAALFAAILISATVQLNSTVSAADAVAAKSPANEVEARRIDRSLRTYANQAELALLASFGSALAVLMLAVLFSLSELALQAPDPAAVDHQGVGWAVFLESLPGALHPRNFFMFLVSYLLLLSTFASLPEWKNTGFFRRQVQDNALESGRRLELLQRKMKLEKLPKLPLSPAAVACGLLGYAIYALLFSLGLQLSVGSFAAGAGYGEVFHAGNQIFWFCFFVFLAVLISSGVETLWLRVIHLQSRDEIMMILSIIVLSIGAFYVFTGEGWWLAFSVAIVVTIFLSWWSILFSRGRAVLLDGDLRPWRFLLNPPRYLIAHRYEVMRHTLETEV